MGQMTEDMTRLHDEIVTSRSNRHQFINDLRDEVLAMLAGFGEDHAEMAQRSSEERTAFISELKDEVDQMMAGMRDASEERRDEVKAMLAGFGEDDKERAAYISDLLARFREEHAEMAQRSREERAAFIEDLAGAGRAFAGASPVGPGVVAEAKPRAEEAREEVMAQPEVEEETLAEVVPDDLTVIRGIGIGRQEQLHEAGIRTLAQLAGSTPEALQRIMGPAGKLVDVAPWIEQAKELLV